MFFVCIFIVFIYVLHVYASLAYLRHYYNLTNQIPENGLTLREKKKILCTNSFPFVRSISLHGQQFFATHPAIVKFTTFPHWEPFFLRYLSHFHCKFYDESWNFRFSKMNWVKLFSCRYQLTFFFLFEHPLQITLRIDSRMIRNEDYLIVITIEPTGTQFLWAENFFLLRRVSHAHW